MASVLACCFFAAALEIDLAPDQPLPFVYTDDPLVVELRSTENIEASVQVRIQRAHQETKAEVAYGPVRLHANGRHWQALKELPVDCGFYTAHITATSGGATTEKTAHFCRMDRAASSGVLPAYAQADTEDANVYLALGAAGIKTLRFDAAWPNIEARLKEALADKFSAVVFIDCGSVPDPVALAGQLAHTFASGIVRWEIDPKGKIEILGAISETLAQAGSVAPVAITVASTAEFQSLMEQQAGRFARECVIVSETPGPEDISALRRIAERAGYEGWGIHVFSTRPGPADVNTPPPLLRLIFQNMALGVLQTGFSSKWVYDSELLESFVYLNGLNRRMPRARYGGQLTLPEPVMAPVFRNGNAWLLAVWTAGNPYSASISLGAARELRLTDAMNNALPVGEGGKESMPLMVDAQPKYLSGVAGSIPGMAARQRAQYLAQAFSREETLQKNLPQEMMANVAAVAAKPGGDSTRDQWLNLVRCFPMLEEQWHAGKLPQAVAVPAMARLSELLRCLCTVEEDRGQPFLEPLQDALARCKEYQSLYLTGSVAADKPHERGDWLLGEVRRLMDEAEALAASGAKIEAVAVATLAEWRARSLEFTMMTPVLQETPPAPPAPAPAPAARENPQKESADPPVESAKAPVEEKAPDESKETVHVVKKGDMPGSIAKKYGIALEDLLKWNNLRKNSVLHIGQKLTVSAPGPREEKPKEVKPKTKKSSSRGRK